MACSTPSCRNRRAADAAVSTVLPAGSGPPSPIPKHSLGVSLPSNRAAGIAAAVVAGVMAAAPAMPAVCINLLREMVVLIVELLSDLGNRRFKVYPNLIR